MSNQPSTPSEFILYQTEDGRTRIQCRFENDTIWLPQTQIASLFQTTVANINIHLKAIYAEGELRQEATIKSYLIVRPPATRRRRRDKCACHVRRLGRSIAKNVAEILEA